ncbi:MAG: transcription termination/antitermination protein NusA [Chloroflexi bacterium]|nr:transcription termination/antitermination protein NusA [Chloroflexota bacterium]
MKSDFLLAITQLSAEKNLPKDVIIGAVEAALVSAYRKENFTPNQNLTVKINPGTGKVQVWAEKTIVERVTDSRRQTSMEEARVIKPDAQLGENIMVESTPSNAGRIAAQTAKQVILQRLHEAEHSAIFDEYAGKEGDIISGAVQHMEPHQIFIDLGRTEAVLPVQEQVRGERYRIGQRVKAYLLEVARTPKGPRVIVSRSHPNFVRRLFELEVPEVYNGIVEIKAVAREAGYRSKVAVAAKQEGIDPIGCCVGLRGIRIQNIVNELSGEKLDVVMWDPNSAAFIANALSPAHAINVQLDQEAGVATVVVPDKQLSLAIGKDGQNARLAAKLTGWRIDIKSASSVEAEKVARAAAAAEAAKLAGVESKEAVAVAEEKPAEEIPVAEPVTAAAEVTEKEAVAPKEAPVVEEVAELLEEEIAAPAEEAGVAEAEPAEELEPMPALDTELAPLEYIPVPAGKSQIRFAEDILPFRSSKPGVKPKKKMKKKGSYGLEGSGGDAKAKRGRRGGGDEY